MKYLCPRDFRRGEMEEYMSNTSVSIESVENLLPKELLELLQPFQIDQIKNMISSFLVMNFSVHEYVFEYRKAMHDQTDERQETIRFS